MGVGFSEEKITLNDLKCQVFQIDGSSLREEMACERK